MGFRVWGFGIRVQSFGTALEFRAGGSGLRVQRVLKGSWDLVTRVIIKVTLLITTYNPN